MKKRTKLIIALGAACVGCLVLGACSSRDNPYGDIAEEGYTVSVYYDANGGLFASTSNVNIVDVYSVEQAKNGVKLVEPGSTERGKGEYEKTVASRSGYFLEGWYQTRELRTDDSGNALDEDGNLCSDSGKEQGYIYSDPWDFDSDVLTVSADYEYTEGEYTLTLYAAWIPYYTYVFYEETDSGWESYNSYSFNPQTATSSLTLDLPSLDDDGVAMVYGNFLQSSGKTFTNAYADEEKTAEYTSSITHSGLIDHEHGVSTDGIMNIYTAWIDGVWYNIYTAQQFYDNASTTGCYNIMADLDFSETSWSAGLARGAFTGQIIGNNHTISNVTITQTEVTQTYGGLFGRISDGAVIENITFTNVSYTLATGSRVSPSNFGLFAGEISTGASFTNVSVSGVLYIGEIYRTANYASYNVGLLSGNSAQTDGITYSITCEKNENAPGNLVVTVENGFIVFSTASTT